MEPSITQTIFHENPTVPLLTVNDPVITENILDNKETKNNDEIETERPTTPDQSPSTKAKLRKVCKTVKIG